jgi:hypothetical protein
MGTMMTGYNCFPGMGGYCSDQAVGLQIGGYVANFALAALGNCIQSRGEKQTLDDKLSTIENNAKEPLKTLNKDGGSYTLSNCDDSLTVEQVFNTAAQATYNDAISKAARNAITKLTDDKNKLEAPKTKNTDGTDNINYNNEKKAYDDKLAEIDKKITELANIEKNLNNVTKSSLSSVKDLVGADVIAAVKAKEDRKAEIQTALDTLKDLNKKHQKVEQEIEANKLNKADGNTLQRMSEDKYKSKFLNDDGNLKDNIDSNDINKKAIRTAAMRLKNAATKDEKRKMAQQYIKLYDNWSDSEEKKGYLKDARLIAENYKD